MGVDEQPSGDIEGTELSEVTSLAGQVDEGIETTQTQSHPLPDELNRTIDPPLGIDGDKMVENQEEPKSKPARKKESSQEQLTHKLYNQLI